MPDSMIRNDTPLPQPENRRAANCTPTFQRFIGVPLAIFDETLLWNLEASTPLTRHMTRQASYK